MRQGSLSMMGYFDKGKRTRREQFLAEMEQVVPWARLYALIEPRYPKGSPAGARPPLPLACRSFGLRMAGRLPREERWTAISPSSGIHTAFDEAMQSLGRLCIALM